MMYKLYILIISLFILGACKQAPKHKAIYSILIDTTDPNITKPNTQEVLDFLNFSDLNTELYVRVRRISEVDDALIQQLHFKPETGLLSNQVEQKRNIRSFKKELGTLSQTKDSLLTSRYSNIFNPLCDELAYLDKLKGFNTKHILVFSDLKENSEWISFYNRSTQNALFKQRKWIEKAFLKQLPELENSTVKITVIHIAKNQQDNREYKAIKKLYTLVFSKQGIAINFAGNLINAPNEL